MSRQRFVSPYTVRRSARARHARFVVSADGLVVVVPNLSFFVLALLSIS